jgi:hypothetical protein
VWQPPKEFEAQVRFAPVAAAVRAAVAAGTYTGPLAGKLIVIQCTAGGAAAAGAGGVFSSHAAAAEHRQSLQRLVRALGGRVCGARAAEVRGVWYYVVCGRFVCDASVVHVSVRACNDGNGAGAAREGVRRTRCRGALACDVISSSTDSAVHVGAHCAALMLHMCLRERAVTVTVLASKGSRARAAEVLGVRCTSHSAYRRACCTALLLCMRVQQRVASATIWPASGICVTECACQRALRIAKAYRST